MVGPTLVDIRDHVDALASDDGTYYVICGRTGERPIPTTGLRFEGRSSAANAARAAEQYRTALRRYDPRLPRYDLIVCQDAGPTPDRSDHERGGGDGRPSADALVEFCHTAAAVVFETLSEGGHDGVEGAIMERYFDLAERLPNPDDLCLCLLGSMAAEVDARLTPREQAGVLDRAASRLGPAPPSDRPVPATLARLKRLGLVGGYSRTRRSADDARGRRSVDVRVAGYALSPHDGRLPVLPVALDLYRRPLDPPPAAFRVAPDGDDWRLTLRFARDGDPAALASAPIRPDDG